jgi:RHS repeat-associated protein
LGTVYYRRNILTSSVYALEQDGKVAAHMTYDDWGKAETEPRMDLNYAGLEQLNDYGGYTYDEVLDLYYVQNRFYDPADRRWISPDPHWGPDNLVYGDNGTADQADGLAAIQVTLHIRATVEIQIAGPLSGAARTDTLPPNLPDPAALAQSANLYAYVLDNPLRYLDPWGLALGWGDFRVEEAKNNAKPENVVAVPPRHAGEYSLSIYSDQNNAHSFVLISNTSDKDITVGIVPLTSGMSVTIGTFGNRTEHTGIFYNLEATLKDTMDNYVSLTMEFDSDQLSTINDFISENDRWSLYNNCSSFVVRMWNSVSDTTLSAGSWWNTPSGLADSIMKQDGYSTGRNFGFAESYGYSQDGKFYCIDSGNSINGGSSGITASSSSGYGAYLTPGSSSDSSSGYSSNSSGSSSGSSGSSTGSLSRIK